MLGHWQNLQRNQVKHISFPFILQRPMCLYLWITPFAKIIFEHDIPILQSSMLACWEAFSFSCSLPYEWQSSEPTCRLADLIALSTNEPPLTSTSHCLLLINSFISTHCFRNLWVIVLGLRINFVHLNCHCDFPLFFTFLVRLAVTIIEICSYHSAKEIICDSIKVLELRYVWEGADFAVIYALWDCLAWSL